MTRLVAISMNPVLPVSKLVIGLLLIRFLHLCNTSIEVKSDWGERCYGDVNYTVVGFMRVKLRFFMSTGIASFSAEDSPDLFLRN
jgi:hypothetical protein